IGVKNGSLGNINNLIGGVYPFSSSTCKILNGESDEYLPVNYPAVIPPGATVAVAQVQIEVLDCFPSNGQLQVMAQGDAYWESVGRVQSVSLGNFHLPFGSFVDLSLNLPENLGEFACTKPVLCPINISNNATSGSPVCRLEISVEGSLLVSVLVPELGPAETWQTSFCLGRFDLGTYAVDIAIDPENQVVEGKKDNNTKQCQFTVSLPTSANLAVTDLRVSVGQPFFLAGQSLFFDDFNRTELGSDWEAFAQSGSVSLPNQILRFDNTSGYTGIKLVDPDFASLQDFTVSFFFEKNDNPTRNQETEVLFRNGNGRWVVLNIKDKELYWIRLTDSDGNSAIGYANLCAGYYQLTAAGNQIRFSNVAGFGTQILLELETTVVQPGSLTFQANEETAFFDDIQVELTGPVMPPDAFRVGNQAYVVWTASNLGQTDSVPCFQTVDLGSQATVIDLPAIAAQTSQEFFLPVCLTALGSQIASVTVDSENLLTEPDEQDNYQEVSINVLPSLWPNLTVALDSLPTKLYVGNNVIVSGTVTNTNTQAAPACQLTLTLGEQSVVIDLPTIEQSQSFSQQFELTKAGDQTVTVEVDSNNAIAETSETDNSQSQTVTVLPPPLPDLTVAGLTLAKTEYLTTENPQLNLVVSNQGNAESPACQLRVQTQAQVLLAQVTVPAIPIGQSQTLTATLPSLAAGSQTIVVVVDFGNAIAESNENNNTSQIQVTVSEPPRPDLLVSQTACQSYRWFFGKVNFTAQVKNNGEQASGSSQISIAVPEMKKTYQKAIAGLNPGQTATFDLTLWSTPKALTFQVTADSQNQVAETNEQNNFTQVKKSF
ncbi:MAG: CARDB domain-containing protein, partial [Candidatus Buchananbacteria bacterium]